MDSPDFPVANRGVLSGIPAQLELIKGKKPFLRNRFLSSPPNRRQSAFAHIEIKK
ncbi:hypothetical protein M5585_21110 [Serratia ureilytica]